ncbi:unnamed protein product [Ceratitis capitata]|uniref:(Mediterranean fruit fly) hypothetical protein n=1 Tax=Ceratitis capitata TaxID=7213 RepID=A0A811UBP8_CERCA|nr:unnamed protein product [Ceratitis capitata]
MLDLVSTIMSVKKLNASIKKEIGKFAANANGVTAAATETVAARVTNSHAPNNRAKRNMQPEQQQLATVTTISTEVKRWLASLHAGSNTTTMLQDFDKKS